MQQLCVFQYPLNSTKALGEKKSFLSREKIRLKQLEQSDPVFVYTTVPNPFSFTSKFEWVSFIF